MGEAVIKGRIPLLDGALLPEELTVVGVEHDDGGLRACLRKGLSAKL